MRVAVGLSGGVDSAVSAALLVQKGYEVVGVFIECWNGPGCRADVDRKDALDIALQLGIPFEVLDFKEVYRKKVVDYFYSEYEAGRTPNPDVMCNKEVKFGLFYEWAMEKGFDFVATGHYARVGNSVKGIGKSLEKAVDEKKDQTYFLYLLREEQLEHILFPIGHLTKAEVRQEAMKRGIKVADKPDSQGICFVGEVRVEDFLKSLGMKEEKGEVVNYDGEVIGSHNGSWFFTVGQRHGFEVNIKNTDKPPLYVIEKDVKKNRLIVGVREQLYKDKFEIGEIHNIDSGFRIQDSRDLKVRIRHGGELVSSKLETRSSKLMVCLDKPVFGVAPGQAVVFYGDDACLGGGIIF